MADDHARAPPHACRADPTHARARVRRSADPQAKAKLNKGRRGSHHLLVFKSDADEAETFEGLSGMKRTPTHASVNSGGDGGAPRMADAFGYTAMGDVASEMKDHVAATVSAQVDVPPSLAATLYALPTASPCALLSPAPTGLCLCLCRAGRRDEGLSRGRQDDDGHGAPREQGAPRGRRRHDAARAGAPRSPPHVRSLLRAACTLPTLTLTLARLAQPAPG